MTNLTFGIDEDDVTIEESGGFGRNGETSSNLDNGGKDELNLAEFRVLTVLADRERPSIRDIATHTQMDKAHVTRALADLMARGLVTQIVDQGDRRLRVVDMTAAGRAVMASTVPFMIARQGRLEGCLSTVELRVLWKALSVLSDEASRMLGEEQDREIHSGAQPRRKVTNRTPV